MTANREMQLIVQYKSAKERLDVAKKEATKAGISLENIERDLLELLEDQGKKRSATFEGLGHVTVVDPTAYASVIKGEEEVLFDYLNKEGRSDLIKLAVSPAGLSVYVRELLKDGKEPPPGTSHYFKQKLRFVPFKH